MVFSSPAFLFLFLPFTLLGYFLAGKPFRNAFLLLASLFFYAWGEGGLVLLMIASICWNYVFGLGIEKAKTGSKKPRSLFFKPAFVLGVGVFINLTALLYYKYAMFFQESMDALGFSIIRVGNIVLPIGISFFTFQSISYLVDVYRDEAPAQKNVMNLGMYIALFPQLIAGPIIRYHDIATQIRRREVTGDLFVQGIQRFSLGLARKLLIANNAGMIADEIFSLSYADLSTPIAWLGICCYALQIYHDFAGYSDMAIGLGKMFGFQFLENFNFPYIARSIREFWRRWHISLSNWFRDYLYIPLGGNRLGAFRTYLNLGIVFFITGLWHGASWNFVVWGLFHGLFLVLERVLVGKIPTAVRGLHHVYVLLVVLVGWVFFRTENLNGAFEYLNRLFVFSSNGSLKPLIYLNFFSVLMLLIGVAFSTTYPQKAIRYLILRFSPDEARIQFLGTLLSLALLFLSMLQLARNTYNPFIYFRF